jgi:tetratricopeptide (TPR) repeat protein
MHIRLSICTSLFRLALIALFFPGRALAQEWKTYALVVGIAKYRDQRIESLQYADRDAREFASLLGWQSNFRNQRTRLLVNEEATVGSIYEGMTWIDAVCRKNDTAIIYFAGHGDLEVYNGKGSGYLLAHNSPANNYPGNAIDLRDLNKLANHLSISKGAVVILITDACHSGKMAGDFQEGKKKVAANLLTVLNREVRMAACLENELSSEGSFWGGGRGVFSYYLTRGMRGEADADKDSKVSLEELKGYIQTSFLEDRYLKGKDKQTPYIDGPGKLVVYRNDWQTPAPGIMRMDLTEKLAAFSDVASSPLDIFFNELKSYPLENCIAYREIEGLPPEAAALRLPELTLNFVTNFNKLFDSTISINNLDRLVKSMEKQPDLRQEYLQKLVNHIQSRSQDMINAYLEGDLAELQRRQYYNYASSNYRNFIPLMDLVMGLIPADDYRLPILSLQKDYLAGLSSRLSMAFKGNKDSLLAEALTSQRSAMNRDPYAAYIRNELGNLFLYAGKYDSAMFHFQAAASLAPTWAVPWSNIINIHVHTGNISAANSAMMKADSLQPGLFSTYLNGGIAAERSGDILRASDLYNRSINANPIHFMGYEQLGMASLRTGDLIRADSMLYEASWRTKDFKLLPDYFKFGLSMGLVMPPPLPDSACLADSVVNVAAKDLDTIIMYMQMLANDPDEGFIDILLKQRAKYPGFPYIDHAIGSAYEKRGDTIRAVRFLKTAEAGYMERKQVDAFISRFIKTRGLGQEGECLRGRLLRSHYRREYDLLALARLEKDNEKALAYLSRASILQSRLLPSIVNRSLPSRPMEYPLEALHEQVVRLRSMGKWKTAERLLLQQSKFNDSLSRANKRNEALIPGSWCSSPEENPWKILNQHFEVFITQFYDSAIARDERNPYWHEQKATYLFGKLLNFFGDERTGIGNRSIPELRSDPQCIDPLFIYWKRKGMNGLQNMELPAYDPFSMAKSHYVTYRSLAGSLSQRPDILEAMARLYMWSGPRDSALIIFSEALRTDPANMRIRAELARLQVDLLHWQDAYLNMEILLQKGALPRDLQPDLCKLTLLKGDSILARKRTHDFLRTTPKGGDRYFWLISILAESYQNPKTQLAILDSMAIPGNPELKAMLFYQKAGVYAILNDKARATLCLETAISCGFNLKNVLARDKRFDRIRDTEAWKKIAGQIKAKTYPRPSLGYGLKKDNLEFNE